MIEYPKPPYPSQQQPMPGSTGAMNPRPDHGEESYRGSGRLAGKKALITGGDSGIGRAVAIAYAREGADIVISYLNEDEDAAEVKALVEQAGRKAILIPGDISNPEHCRSIVRRTVEELGGIDILVNNAAHQATFKDIADISDEEWQRTFETNIHAMFYLTKAAVPHMRPGAAIINTASVNSDMPNPTLLAYATTKGAIQNFTGGLAQMLAEKGIRVNAVAPGADLDAADPVDDVGGKGQEFRQAGPDAARRPAGRARDRLCHAGRSALELHLGGHLGRHRREAVHLIEGASSAS
ncbi:NAD(P)-dependent dehydrogenase (short-subunit alcohol dehydrogenase family) [Bradyrhizobium ottawaense]